MESGTFNNLNEVIAKFVSSCNEAYGQHNSILAFNQNIDQRNRDISYRGTYNRNHNFNNNNGNGNSNNNRYNHKQRGKRQW